METDNLAERGRYVTDPGWEERYHCHCAGCGTRYTGVFLESEREKWPLYCPTCFQPGYRHFLSYVSEAEWAEADRRGHADRKG